MNSEETKRKIRQGLANMSEEKKKEKARKTSEAQKNMCWVSNEHEIIRIKNDELDYYISIGYLKQRKLINKEENKNESRS